MPVKERLPRHISPMLRLPLRGDEISDVNEMAQKHGQELDEFVAELVRTYWRSEYGSLVVTPEDSREIQKTLGRNFQSNKAGLARCVANMATVSVEGLEIQLPENLLQRLKSRCIHQPDFREWLRGVIILTLQQYVGLR